MSQPPTSDEPQPPSPSSQPSSAQAASAATDAPRAPDRVPAAATVAPTTYDARAKPAVGAHSSAAASQSDSDRGSGSGDASGARWNFLGTGALLNQLLKLPAEERRRALLELANDLGLGPDALPSTGFSVDEPVPTTPDFDPSNTTADSHEPRAGGVAARPTGDRYELLEVIGHGGMGLVYRAEQRWPV